MTGWIDAIVVIGAWGIMSAVWGVFWGKIIGRWTGPGVDVRKGVFFAEKWV